MKTTTKISINKLYTQLKSLLQQKITEYKKIVDNSSNAHFEYSAHQFVTSRHNMCTYTRALASSLSKTYALTKKILLKVSERRMCASDCQQSRRLSWLATRRCQSTFSFIDSLSVESSFNFSCTWNNISCSNRQSFLRRYITVKHSIVVKYQLSNGDSNMFNSLLFHRLERNGNVR